ncbi:hypothetical protein G9C98_004976 [Cotesia typhae]|uniref:Soluble interferon alpha/beta receptor OPG204 n=1 Tax=Cotesia typhae TaxID=2053667 RepID=A0A8J5R5E6_9HYME|nr:hypothetical protein G9C98_004976 [Cotesia typhae]
MTSRRISSWCIKTLIVVFSIVAVVIGGSPPSRDDELEDYCSAHKFDKLLGGLRFTKEVVTTEYANIGAFKAIHCCLRGYRSIEWIYIAIESIRAEYKSSQEADDIEGSQRRVELVFQVIREEEQSSVTSHAGTNYPFPEDNYREDSSGYTGKPLPTYKPISQLVPLGDAARLFCEAYLGKVDLPDAKNSVTWAKSDSNITFLSSGRISKHRVSREDDQIVGAYLEIESTIAEDYGEYECRISNGADEEMTLSAYIYRRDGKEIDALVCYHEKDAALAVNTLIPTLKTKYHYKCTTLELTHITRNWNLEIGTNASSSRRVIVILSPNALQNEWTDTTVTQALKQLSLISNQVIVIILNELSNVATFAKSTGHCIDAACADGIVLNKMTILRWKVDSENDIGSYKFWCRLRLALPPVRSVSKQSSPDFQSRCQSVAMIVQNNTKSTPQKTQSRESLEVLV